MAKKKKKHSLSEGSSKKGKKGEPKRKSKEKSDDKGSMYRQWQKEMTGKKADAKVSEGKPTVAKRKQSVLNAGFNLSMHSSPSTDSTAAKKKAAAQKATEARKRAAHTLSSHGMSVVSVMSQNKLKKMKARKSRTRFSDDPPWGDTPHNTPMNNTEDDLGYYGSSYDTGSDESLGEIKKHKESSDESWTKSSLSRLERYRVPFPSRATSPADMAWPEPCTKQLARAKERAAAAPDTRTASDRPLSSLPTTKAKFTRSGQGEARTGLLSAASMESDEWQPPNIFALVRSQRADPALDALRAEQRARSSRAVVGDRASLDVRDILPRLRLSKDVKTDQFLKIRPYLQQMVDSEKLPDPDDFPPELLGTILNESLPQLSSAHSRRCYARREFLRQKTLQSISEEISPNHFLRRVSGAPPPWTYYLTSSLLEDLPATHLPDVDDDFTNIPPHDMTLQQLHDYAYHIVKWTPEELTYRERNVCYCLHVIDVDNLPAVPFSKCLSAYLEVSPLSVFLEEFNQGGDFSLEANTCRYDMLDMNERASQIIAEAMATEVREKRSTKGESYPTSLTSQSPSLSKYHFSNSDSSEMTQSPSHGSFLRVEPYDPISIPEHSDSLPGESKPNLLVDRDMPTLRKGAQDKMKSILSKKSIKSTKSLKPIKSTKSLKPSKSTKSLKSDKTNKSKASDSSVRKKTKRSKRGSKGASSGREAKKSMREERKSRKKSMKDLLKLEEPPKDEYRKELLKVIKNAVKDESQFNYATMLPRLRRLRLVGCEMTYVDKTARNLKSLLILNLAVNWIKEVDGSMLPRSLGFLELFCNLISDLSPLLNNFPPCLMYLGLARNRICDESNLLQLTKMENLRALDLGDNDLICLTDVLQTLTGLQNLLSLNLHGNPCSTAAAYGPMVILTLPQLLALDDVWLWPKDHERDPQTKLDDIAHKGADVHGALVVSLLSIVGIPKPKDEVINNKKVVTQYVIEMELPLLDPHFRKLIPPPDDTLAVSGSRGFKLSAQSAKEGVTLTPKPPPPTPASFLHPSGTVEGALEEPPAELAPPPAPVMPSPDVLALPQDDDAMEIPKKSMKKSKRSMRKTKQSMRPTKSQMNKKKGKSGGTQSDRSVKDDASKDKVSTLAQSSVSNSLALSDSSKRFAAMSTVNFTEDMLHWGRHPLEPSAFESEPVEWNKVIEPKPLVVVAPDDDLMALRDTFRTHAAIRLIQLRVLRKQDPTKKSEEKGKKNKGRKKTRKKDDKVKEAGSKPKPTILEVPTEEIVTSVVFPADEIDAKSDDGAKGKKKGKKKDDKMKEDKSKEPVVEQKMSLKDVATDEEGNLELSRDILASFWVPLHQPKWSEAPVNFMWSNTFDNEFAVRAPTPPPEPEHKKAEKPHKGDKAEKGEKTKKGNKKGGDKEKEKGGDTEKKEKGETKPREGRSKMKSIRPSKRMPSKNPSESSKASNSSIETSQPAANTIMVNLSVGVHRLYQPETKIDPEEFKQWQSTKRRARRQADRSRPITRPMQRYPSAYPIKPMATLSKLDTRDTLGHSRAPSVHTTTPVDESRMTEMGGESSFSNDLAAQSSSARGASSDAVPESPHPESPQAVTVADAAEREEKDRAAARQMVMDLLGL